ncbi:MAG: prolipoprotein diacylglyceryl transferase [Cyclobacteriaceae bacterium]
MHPELFTIGGFTIHGYGFMIMIGAIIGYFYMSTTVKKELGIEPEKVQSLAIFVILAAFIGGKLLFYFEDPSYYFSEPSRMIKGFRTGFVFYGSLLFVIPVTIWFFRKEKWPVWPMMDRLAITACLVHMCGRMGCFLAGCCHGLPTESILGVTYTDLASQAEPLGVALHPTPLYEITMILLILIVLIMVKRHKKFDGQLFMVYIILYAIGRSVIEVFRGDVRRGFIIEDVLSHSQFISLLVIAGAVGVYLHLKKKGELLKG